MKQWSWHQQLHMEHIVGQSGRKTTTNCMYSGNEEAAMGKPERNMSQPMHVIQDVNIPETKNY